LLALDRRGHAAAGHIRRETAPAPNDDGGVENEDEDPHGEWCRSRQRDPARVAEEQRRDGQCREGDRERHRYTGDDVQTAQSYALALDELEWCHGTGRLVTA
jgi:hypothetical protein